MTKTMIDKNDLIKELTLFFKLLRYFMWKSKVKTDNPYYV